MSLDGKRPRRRRRSFREGSGISMKQSIPIWVVALIVVLLRIYAASAFQEQALLASPVLEDATYLTAIQQSHADNPVEPVLPRGSVLYPRIVGWLPGIVEGDVHAVAVFQGILDGLAVLVFGLWIAFRWGVLPAAIGGMLYALDPLGAFFTARLVPTSASVLVFAAALLLFDGNPGSWRRGPAGAFVFGLVAALGFLLSPLLFLVLALVVAYRRAVEGRTSQSGNRPALRGRIGGAVLALAPLVLTVIIISARHDQLRDGGPAISWGSAVSVYNATHAETGGTARMLDVPQWQTEGSYRSETWEALAREGTSYDLFRFYLARGLQALVEKPVGYIGVELVKLAATLGAAPLPDAGPNPSFVLERAGGRFSWGRWSFAILLGLGIAGWLAAPAGFVRRRLLLGLATVGAVCLLGTTSAASRQPAVLLLAFGAGSFLASLLGRLEGGRARSALPLVAVPALAALSLLLGRLSPTSALLDPSEEFRLGGTTAMARSPREAVPLLEQAVRTNPGNVEARVSLARAYQRDGLIEGAVREYRNAFAIDSTNTGVLLGVASIEQEDGNSDRAIELVSRLVRTHPNNPLFLNEAGRMLLQVRRWDLAKPLLVRALEIKPDYRTAQTNLEAATRMEMDVERSLIPDEMRLPEDDPFNATLAQIGAALQQGQLAVADSLIRIGETERSDNILPHWMRAAYYARTGDIEDAAETLELCQRLAPCRPAIVAQLAQLYMQIGREADARRLLDDCIASPPTPELGASLEQIRGQLFDQ